MPPKRRNNNKKKKWRGGGSGRPASASSSNANATVGANASQKLIGKIPDFLKLMEANSGANWSSIKEHNYPSVYLRYKAATNRCVTYMMENTPDSVLGNRRNVNALLRAADWMLESQHVVANALILKDLRLAIRQRDRTAKTVYGGGDEGHRHFLEVLRYCYFVLKDLRILPQGEGEVETGGTQQKNSYSALMEDDSEGEEEDEEVFPSTKMARPEPEPESQSISLEDLLYSDDRNDAILFLFTLDELMKTVSDQYQEVARSYIDYKNQKCPDSAIVGKLLEAAVSTNMAIQQVQQLEGDLVAQHPTLTTPYRLLAILAFPEITQRVGEILHSHSHSSTSPTAKDITSYLGDCLECCIRNPSDQFNKKDTIVHKFCDEWKIDASGSKQLDVFFDAIRKVTSLELPVANEAQMNRLLYQELGAKSHTWIQNMPFIGGDQRAIHHTLRLLQAFGTVVYDTPNDRQIVPKRGIFGTPWRPGQATRITGNLDELLMSDILPQWVTMCRHGVIGKADLPRQDELCPLFVSILSYVKNPEKPVLWSTTFAIHALLTAVFEVDRAGIGHQLSMTSKEVFQGYFRMHEWATDLSRKEEDSVQSSQWAHNMLMVGFLDNLGLPVFGDLALWNPLCAGTTFLYLTYFGNLEAGCCLIDCHAQLRIVLHLYHALIDRGILRSGQLPCLDMLYFAFRKSKAIWEGTPPQQGEFVQRFWICFGSSIADAKRMSESAKHNIIGSSASHGATPETQSRQSSRSNTISGTRKMSPIEPADISKSFRRICYRDFHDVVDKYHTAEQRRRSKGTDQYLFAVRTNDTLDAIEDEQQLLAFHFPSTGVLLEQFVCSLGRILQWEPLLGSRSNMPGLGTPPIAGTENMKRQGFAYLFAQFLLGALDFSVDPFSHEFMGVPLGQATATFMSAFFGRLDPSRVRWFQAIAVQEED